MEFQKKFQPLKAEGDFLVKHEILRRFGYKIKQLRTSKGWSQEELAKRAKLHRTYIGSIERSERNVSLLNIERIAKALNIKIKDLIDK